MNGHVYLIDDNPDILKHLHGVLVRYGLSVECYEDSESFLRESIEVAPAVVLLDMDLPGINGIATHEQLIQSGRLTPVIYISGRSEHQQIIDALKLGALDFLLKPFSIAKLLDAISVALRIDETRIQRQVESLTARMHWSKLTDREKEVCRLMLKGLGNNQISAELHVMPDTVKKHRARILDKFSVRSLSQLIEQVSGIDLK